MTEPTDRAEHEIRFEIEGLISLLAQNLYADPDVFLREMVQNAHDSIVKRRELAAMGARGERPDALPRPEIRVDASREGRTLTITDDGAGLTRDEIHRHLSTIGASGTRDLKKTLAERDRTRTVDLIGQFGIGLLSAYIVAARVEIVTRSAVEPALRWSSDGGKRYHVGPAERADVGTSVVLHLKPDHLRYLEPDRLRSIVRRYADFIGIPVIVGGELANAVDAPWHRLYPGEPARRLAHRDYWEGRFKNETSLDILPLDEPADCPDPLRPGERVTARVRGVLGITDRHVPDVNTRGTVEIYVARMFITSGSRDALPPWARFIQGIVECDALTPNAARDDVVKNEALEAVKAALGRAILAWLTRLSREDPKRFVEIMRWHSYHVLAMAAQDEHEDFFRAVADLVPLASDQGPLTLPEYLATAARVSDRPVVHYLTERGSVNQYYVLCAARGIRVFDASEPFAERFLVRYAKTWPDRLRLSRLDVTGSEVIFEPLSDADPDKDRFRDLEAAYALVFPDLRCIAKVSRFKPSEMPAVLTESRDQKTRREMEEVAGNVGLPGFIRDLVQGFLKDKREPLTLHLNAENPTVQRLARRGTLRDAVAQNALVALYNNALMLLSRMISPDDVRLMFQQYNTVIDLMLGLADERAKLGGENAALRSQVLTLEREEAGASTLTRWPTCFVAMPFRPETDAVYAALREVLEDVPFLWQVTRADAMSYEANRWENIKAHMQRAHCFVAEVSDGNLNVYLEVGRMEALDRPLALLKRDGSPELPVDLKGHLYVAYGGEGPALVERLRAELGKLKPFVEQKGERFLSETVLRKCTEGQLGDGALKKLAQAFETCDDFLAADAGEASRRLGIMAPLVQGAQGALRGYLERMPASRRG
jgi:molecular chaperone HtpG